MARKRKQKKSKQKRFFAPLFKWLAIAAIWSSIFIILLAAWYATELPGLVEETKFERKSAITIKASDDSIITRYGELKGTNVSVSDLPPHLVYAVIATEDRRFYQHRGIDPIGMARAAFANMRAKRLVQGGSTITQQLAKNLFLSRDRTLKRKIQEAMLAVWLEKQLTKDEILSAYLNRVYLGSGTYGVDAAARLYFDKPAQEVTLREAALLAGLLKAPSRYSPHSNPGLAAKRAKVVLAAMADAGYISPEEAETEALSTPLPRKKPGEGGATYYFSDWAVSSLGKLVGTPRHDLVVETTLDPALQESAETVLNRVLREKGADVNVSQGAILVMAPDGAILAMAGGRNYDASQFNRTTQAQRPPGSSFKPVVFLAALAAGWSRYDRITDAPLTTGTYRPANFKDEYAGEVTLEDAMARSLNTAAVRLAQQVGLSAVLQTAKTLGITTDLPRDLSIALGSHGIPMIEMVTAYAVIANGGYPATPYGIVRVTTDEGQLLYNRIPLKPRRTAIPPRAIQALDDMLREVVRNGTGRQAALDFTRAAGKTGTSQDFRDAWFVGYTDNYVAAVWLGNDDNTPMKGVTGGSLPAKIWHDLMEDVYKKRKGFFPLPSSPPSAGANPAGGMAGLLQRILGVN